MIEKIEFILNDEHIITDVLPNHSLLDFIRYNSNYKGTKIGCREGDCGICSVLVGDLIDGELRYEAIISCLTPIANIQGKHVVTIEGINLDQQLNLFQSEMVHEGGTQCGFCTPGFIVSFTGYLISQKNPEYKQALQSIDGNICRCTGYKSIERAISNTIDKLAEYQPLSIPKLIQANVIPNYFTSIPEKLKQIKKNPKNSDHQNRLIMGGGTDLYVQIPEKLPERETIHLKQVLGLNYININNSKVIVGASTSPSLFLNNQTIRNRLMNNEKIRELFASTLIRNVATFGGNLVNASPIGDFTIIFLALNSEIAITDGVKHRNLPLREFYLGYKNLDLTPNEYIKEIRFDLPEDIKFNFEKVSKRTHLDIASVNSAISIGVDDQNKIKIAGLSAGGISPIPLYLNQTVDYLVGKQISIPVVREAASIAMNEISPISDIRGSKEYKQLLLRQLIFAHFVELFPELIRIEEVIA